MTRIQLWNGDVCELWVDAIVSPANPSLWMSSGVAEAGIVPDPVAGASLPVDREVPA